MDCDSAFGQVCFCRREFTHPSALTNHQKICKRSNTRLANALAKAREYVASKKRAAESINVVQDIPQAGVLAAVHEQMAEVRTITVLYFVFESLFRRLLGGLWLCGFTSTVGVVAIEGTRGLT